MNTYFSVYDPNLTPFMHYNISSANMIKILDLTNLFNVKNPDKSDNLSMSSLQWTKKSNNDSELLMNAFSLKSYINVNRKEVSEFVIDEETKLSLKSNEEEFV